ncbi:MAG TPA: hypothetical protein PLU43_05995, partial [Lachnospiraceae bacterium]|nr:hypothetical protein [Lachnospiraceae bacterium]
LLHLCITFFTDRQIFTVSPKEGAADYILCKCLAYAALFFFYLALYHLLIDKNRKEQPITKIIKCALPYLIVLAVVMVIKLPGGYLSNDETLIYNAAVSLTHYTWFYYITTYYYIVSLMLIPNYFGPIMIKILIEFLTVGYFVYRLKRILGNSYGSFGYLLFLLYPVIAYTTSAHRLPIYYLLYLVLITTLLFDYMEKKELHASKALSLLFLGAILTQWRTEGIYLVVLLPILLFLVYKNIRTKKNALAVVFSFLLIQYIVSVPQNGLLPNNMDAAANDRMKPFYAYTITNMVRNNLNREKNAEDLAIVDQYLSLDTMDAINDYYGDINYEDVLILYKEGYIGTRPDATIEDFTNYAAALKRIFINNPGVFLKTRWGAFCYAALPYKITFEGLQLRQLFSFAVSIVKTISYNLFIPLSIILLLCIYALVKRRWFTFFTAGGLLAHWFIVFILAPASYFKYYFPVYIIAYFYVLLLILQLVYNRKQHENLHFIV